MLIFVYHTGCFTVRLFALITHQTIILALFFCFVFVSLRTHIRALFHQTGRLHLFMQRFTAFSSLSKTERHSEWNRIKHGLVKEASVQFRVVKFATDWVDSCHVIENRFFKFNRSLFPSLSLYLFLLMYCKLYFYLKFITYIHLVGEFLYCKLYFI